MYNVGVLLPLTNVRAIMYYNMLRYADDVSHPSIDIIMRRANIFVNFSACFTSP